MAKKAIKKAPAMKKKAARKPRTTKAKSSTLSEVSSISEAQVRERAYEISLARKGPADPVADWFQAEQELKTDLHA